MGRNLGPLNIKDSYEGLVQISGSQLTDGSGSLIPSLDVTASFATTATSATTAISASHAIIADSALTATSASHALNADNAISSSYAVTASFALNAGASTLQEVLDAGNTATQDFNLTGSVDIVGNLDLGGTGNSISGMLGSAIVVGSNQTISGGGDGGIYSGRGNIISSGLFGATLGGDGNTNSHNRSVVIGGTGLSTTKDDEVVVPSLVANSITASFASFQSASIGYLQTVTGSATIIGDAFIILNNDTPTQRFAGLKVYDSGSANVTASLQWDGLTHDWKYEYSSSAEHEGGVLLTGPEGADLATLPYPANNAIQKGTGTHHLASSSMTDDGTLVTIDANVSASGYVSASSFIGDGSQLTGISTDPFPYTGSAQITGSLGVTGSVDIVASGTNAPFLNSVTAGAPAAGEAVIAIASGDANIIGNARASGIFGATNATIGNTGYQSVVVGGDEHDVDGIRTGVFGGYNNNVSSGNSYIFGGSYHDITGGSGQIYGGRNSTISGGTSVVTLGGNNNTISAGTYNALVGGSGNTTTHNYSVVIGGQSLSTTKADEVVVPSLSVYGDTFISASVLGTGSLIDNLGQEAIVTGSQVQHIVNLSQAEYDALTPDANTLYVIDGTETLGNTVVSGSLVGAVNTLTDAAGTTALDCSVGNYFTLAMPAGGSTTLTPSNITAGQTINIKITQNATAATLAYAASIEFPGGTAFTISTGAGAVDVLTLVSFDGTTLQATGLANFS